MKEGKAYSFEKNHEKLYPLALEIVDTLKEELGGQLAERIERECRVVIIELLTNALKHVEEQSVVVKSRVEQGRIIISKIAQGKKLWMLDHLVQPDEDHPPAQLAIYEDVLSTLYAVREDHNLCCFKITEHDLLSSFPVEGLLEHYGLLLITRCSDRFTYRYNPVTGENIFTVEISLG